MITCLLLLEGLSWDTKSWEVEFKYDTTLGYVFSHVSHPVNVKTRREFMSLPLGLSMRRIWSNFLHQLELNKYCRKRRVFYVTHQKFSRLQHLFTIRKVNESTRVTQLFSLSPLIWFTWKLYFIHLLYIRFSSDIHLNRSSRTSSQESLFHPWIGHRYLWETRSLSGYYVNVYFSGNGRGLLIEYSSTNVVSETEIAFIFRYGDQFRREGFKIGRW